MSNLIVNNENGICTLTINRPENLNVLNYESIEELLSFFTQAKDNADIKVIILTGAGSKSFVAGGDISKMAKADPQEAIAFARKAQKLMRTMETLPKHIIAAVNGFALGGGLEIALACDFIYASDNAKFGFPEVSLGIIPGFGGTQNLPRLIGANKTREMIFTGKMIDAEKAEKWGIVNHVSTQENLMEDVLKTAKDIIKNGLIAVCYGKECVDRGMNMSKEDAFLYESSLFGALFSTEDQKEGMAAFLEKRKAEFKNR
ncbi:MAG: enoyl-CoA hydratase [Denitrovibrio sp.]|nr:MAG: enoyl-CoA hydratase [Denitrovibrio sp.]